MGSIFFPLRVAPVKTFFLSVETYATVQKSGFNDTDTNILKGCVFLYCLLCNQIQNCILWSNSSAISVFTANSAE